LSSPKTTAYFQGVEKYDIEVGITVAITALTSPESVARSIIEGYIKIVTYRYLLQMTKQHASSDRMAWVLVVFIVFLL